MVERSSGWLRSRENRKRNSGPAAPSRQLWSNPGEVVLTPFMGVGSEVYQAVKSGRRGIGIELKPTYYRQAIRNVAEAEKECTSEHLD